MYYFSVCLGIQAHRSTHPCFACTANGRLDFADGFSANFRTIEHLKENAQKFMAQTPKIKSKECFNVVNPPLFYAQDDEYVLDLIFIPSLHVLLGVCFKIMSGIGDELGQGLIGQNKIVALLIKIKVLQDGDQLSDMNGPACNKLLDRLDLLRENLPTDLHKYVDLAECFGEVKKACFSSDLLPGWDEKIDEFEQLYDEVGMTVTTKVHALVRHVREQCYKYDQGLGAFSEQAVESSHFEFKEIWKRYE